MKEIVVISGKGGTGKTSVVASLASLAKRCVLIDCDVDAADLHLIFEPKILRRESFTGGSKAWIKGDECTACGTCAELCRFHAISFDGPKNGSFEKTYQIDRLSCEGCGVCVDHCPEKAIGFSPETCGEWFVSETRCGPMVHAKLGIAADNSGKLVTQIRRAAMAIAKEKGIELMLSDGSPGIGCPVIASLTGASLALFVVEPTVSGVHDFARVAELATRLGVPGILTVNKADLNEAKVREIEVIAGKFGIKMIGRIPYDKEVTRSQIAMKTVVEYSDGPASQAIRLIWNEVQKHFASAGASTVDGFVQLKI